MRTLRDNCIYPKCVAPLHREGAKLCLEHKKANRKLALAKYARINRKQESARLKSWRTGTINGFLCFVYSNMRNRIKGVTGHPMPHLWKGKCLLSKEAFYKWAKQDFDFIKLFNDWQEQGRDRLVVPSIDRIDSDKGYELGNMRWVTFQENCRSFEGPQLKKGA